MLILIILDKNNYYISFFQYQYVLNHFKKHYYFFHVLFNMIN